MFDSVLMNTHVSCTVDSDDEKITVLLVEGTSQGIIGTFCDDSSVKTSGYIAAQIVQ
jgi:hypothetical protein